MHGGHLDYESEEVINKGIDALVCHRLPIEMGYALQLVIDEKLGHHHYEAKHVDEANQHIEYPGVPPLVFLVKEGIHAVSCHKGHRRESSLMPCTMKFQPIHLPILKLYRNGLGDFPHVNSKSYAVRYQYHKLVSLSARYIAL